MVLIELGANSDNARPTSSWTGILASKAQYQLQGFDDLGERAAPYLVGIVRKPVTVF